MSGTTEERVQYRAMLELARKQQLDVVLVWWYVGSDGRPLPPPRGSPARPRHWSMRSKNSRAYGLTSFASALRSYQENIDTTTPTGELIFHVMASLAQSLRRSD